MPPHESSGACAGHSTLTQVSENRAAVTAYGDGPSLRWEFWGTSSMLLLQRLSTPTVLLLVFWAHLGVPIYVEVFRRLHAGVAPPRPVVPRDQVRPASFMLSRLFLTSPGEETHD
ncbi:uncharacterized protein SCHCODRAFT_02500130 [Schizophyllum commune H4-8]|nr:uncharacterized protein SCHCODRAFT_02500130 [Schizophyllum commune H4-8]KAI5893444.1 hypothetical protein SCHCODRAFT_02500130 [Schizophyllum commune H4-8]